jgi:hypothetical protein
VRYDGTGEDGLSHASTLPIVQWFRKLQLLFGVIPRCIIATVKDTPTMLRHTKPDTAQINYMQPVEDSVRSAVDRLAATLLG